VKPGRDADGVAQAEADYFGSCPVREALVSPKFAFCWPQEASGTSE